MTEPVDNDEDLFADLYEADDEPAPAPVAPVKEEPVAAAEQITLKVEPNQPELTNSAQVQGSYDASNSHPKDEYDDSVWQGHSQGQHVPEQEHSGIMVKEDGKMFIGGLNWETTDEGLRDYFTQFGEVQECTVMRDGATGRSRGFGFLTFKDPKTVNIVMVKEHFLDGKLIDPKRAIPRDEQEKTSKIFVGGVSQDATEEDFEQYFAQFGRVLDATLMMDKDTGRPRGFGFVTFDNEAAVDACLRADLRILGKPVEVKKAQPRGDIRAEEERGGPKGRGGGRGGGGFQDHSNQGPQVQNQQGSAPNGMSPSMMVQYWQKMQQMMSMWQAQQAMMGGMNPAMMQQMQMAQMQKMQQQMGMSGKDGNAAMQGMNPQMMQQMMMAQQQQQQQQQGQGQRAQNGGGQPDNYNNGNQQPPPQQQQQQPMAPMPGVPTGPSGNRRNNNNGGGGNYNRQDAQIQQFSQIQNPESWEGMYDDVPQPNMPPSGPSGNRGGQNGGGNYGRGAGGDYNRGGNGGMKQQGGPPPAGPSNAPAGAPTGPRNANVPGSNYRGGGRGGHAGGGRGRGYHPYRR